MGGCELGDGEDVIKEHFGEGPFEEGKASEDFITVRLEQVGEKGFRRSKGGNPIF